MKEHDFYENGVVRMLDSHHFPPQHALTKAFSKPFKLVSLY
jgi:hypothetical protein